MLNAVLIDLDNTMVLFDEPSFYERYFEKIIPWFADMLPAAEFRQTLLQATRAMRQNEGAVSNRKFFLDRFCTDRPAQRQEVWRRFTRFYATDYDRIPVDVGVPSRLTQVLDRLGAWGLKLVVATNPIFPPSAPQRRLAWGGIDPGRFMLLTHIDNSAYVKPRLEYYRQICHTIGEPPERCLMVGNDPVNDMAAGAAGLKTFLTLEAGEFDTPSISLTDGPRDRALKIPEPDFTGPFREVPAVVARLGGDRNRSFDTNPSGA